MIVSNNRLATDPEAALKRHKDKWWVLFLHKIILILDGIARTCLRIPFRPEGF